MMSATMDDKSASHPPPGTEEMQWFVLKVQSNREKSIRDSLLRRIKREGLEELFGEIVIPTEKVVETKGGKKKVKEQKLYPGYMMIHMVLNEETWYLVRDTSGVGDFTGAAGKPIRTPSRPSRSTRSASNAGAAATSGYGAPGRYASRPATRPRSRGAPAYAASSSWSWSSRPTVR